MALETVSALIARGFNVTVAVPGPGPLIELLTRAGADVLRQPTPVIRKSSLSLIGLFRLTGETLSNILSSWRLLRRSRAGTVLVNTITTPLWFPLARVAGLRVACHLHEAEGTVAAPLRWAMHVPLQFCHRVIANSEYTRKVLSESSLGLASRVVVVYNTVPGPEVVLPPRLAVDDEVRLLYVGRLSQRKGPHVAATAAGLLRDRGMNVRLDIVGSVFPGNEGYEVELRKLVSDLGISENVHFHGFQQLVWPYFADCDIVLVPSVGEESFGNTAVEAALAARPVVASGNAGLREATSASESAELVPSNDPEAMSLAVERIARAWDHYAAAALTDAERVAARFSAKTYEDSLIHTLGLVGIH
ncbi:MAG: glycosyltransferase family 4 protein [Propionibacteriaceae bacterium]|nr:glycosyltransferase family 4 protein [Propionibacteriaceae bacterium]